MDIEEENLPGEDQDELDRVLIKDNGEPLIDFLGLSPKLVMSPARPRAEWPRVHVVREGMAQMLVQAAEALPKHLRLCVIEGYRPIQVQRAMYAFAVERVMSQHPEWNPAKIATEAGRWSAPPDAITPPPHLTGGAADLEIVNLDGETLDFSSPYERSDWHQALPFAKGLSEEAQANRTLLRSILEPTGLTNYVDEWWHWSYGDNGWALRVGAAHALYGRIELAEDVDWIGDRSKLPS